MLKETPKSLRLYFAFVAGLSLLPIAAVIFQGRLSDLVSLTMLLNFTMAGLFAYVVIRFQRLLRNPKPIVVILVASGTLSVISFVASWQGGTPTFAQVAGLTLAVLITLYLLKSVTRLSKEVSAENA